MGKGDIETAFENFYTAHFGDTVAMTYGFTADLGEAQDIAQEAFSRAWQRWRDVSTYDNPVAWVRRVATNLAHSRWRRLKTAAAYLLRERPDDYTAAIEPDHVAVVAALRKLPTEQRTAIVLHYLVDLPVTDVAEQLDVPVGTVKSWLYRGRSALAQEMRIDVSMAVTAVTTPPAEDVVKLAKKHQRVRVTAATTAVIMALLGAYFAVQLVRNDGPPPLPPGQTPTAPTTVAPDDPMRQINWSTATIDFRDVPAGCPSGRVTLGPVPPGQNWPVAEGAIVGPLDGWPKARVAAHKVAIGNLNGDGPSEAALTVTCVADENADDMTDHVLVVQRSEDGSLTTMGWVGRDSSLVKSTWIDGGALYVDNRPHPSSQTWQYGLGDVDSYGWEGDRFIGPSTHHYGFKLHLEPVLNKVPCSVAQIDAGDSRLSPWNSIAPIWAELGRPGQPYLLLSVDCESSSSGALVIFDGAGVNWGALDAIPDVDLADAYADKIDTTDGTTYRWDGTAFVRQ